jgi:hypothetical protein
VAGPDPAGRAHLGDFLEEIVVDVPEEREARREGVHRESAGQPVLDVGESVGEREGQLLHRGGARLADVIAGNRDRIPAGRVLRGPLEHVHDDLERGFGRIHPGMLAMYSFRMSFWTVP